MCYQASVLYEKYKLAEIAVRLKIGAGQERFVAEQTHNLQKLAAGTFHRNILQHIDTFYTPVIEKAGKIAEENNLAYIWRRIERSKQHTATKSGDFRNNR